MENNHNSIEANYDSYKISLKKIFENNVKIEIITQNIINLKITKSTINSYEINIVNQIDKIYDKFNLPLNIIFANFHFSTKIKFDLEEIDKKIKDKNIKIYFENCIFDKIEHRQNTFYASYKFENSKFEILKFIDCTFDNSLSFKKSVFEKEFKFENCLVESRANFSNTKFINNAYFNNTEFSDYSDFHEAEFEAVACFYGVTFEKPMNFSSVIFKDFNKADFVNLNIEKIDIRNIKEAVKDNYKDESYRRERKNNSSDKKCKEIKDEIKKLHQKYKIRWANNFRDSFRVIKHSLIETNNNLEASNFHKLELYAKEIELEYQIEKENPNFATQKNAKVEYKKENHKFNIINWLILIVSIVIIFKYPIIFSKSIASIAIIFLSPILTFALLFCWFLFLYSCGHLIIFIVKFINSKTYKDAINYIIYIIQTFYNSINKYINKEYFKTLLDYTKYIDYWKIRIYRNTSEHHTNFTRILNFTIVMISLYGLFIFLINKTVAQNSTEFVAINVVFTILIMLVFVYFAYVLSLPIIANMGLALILMLVCVTKIFSLTILSFYGEITFFAVFYLLSVLLLYRLFIAKNNLITFTIRAVAYIGFLFMIYISPSIVLPFSNLNSQEFKTEYLENNISQANKVEIIELASIINKEFNATKNPNSSENLSISELNEYKKFIVENKDDLYKKLDDEDKFKQAIYADSSRDKTIKCISFIYAIILGLCLFSLQKTARRNSVVPS